MINLFYPRRSIYTANFYFIAETGVEIKLFIMTGNEETKTLCFWLVALLKCIFLFSDF